MEVHSKESDRNAELERVLVDIRGRLRARQQRVEADADQAMSQIIVSALRVMVLNEMKQYLDALDYAISLIEEYRPI